MRECEADALAMRPDALDDGAEVEATPIRAASRGQSLIADAAPAEPVVSGADAPEADAVELRWSADGHSAAVWMRARLMGFIANATGPGYSTGLRASGPFGNVLDEELYAAVFGDAASG